MHSTFDEAFGQLCRRDHEIAITTSRLVDGMGGDIVAAWLLATSITRISSEFYLNLHNVAVTNGMYVDQHGRPGLVVVGVIG